MAQRARVLIGDNNDTTTLRMSAKLSADGFEVTTANSLDTFLGSLKDDIPDAVLLGQFPDINQADAAIQAKDISAPRPLPMMLFNCQSDTESRRKILDAQVQDMIEGIPNHTLLENRMRLLTRISTLQSELERRVKTAAEFDIEVSPWVQDRFKGKIGKILIIREEGEDISHVTNELSDRTLEVDVEDDFYRAADRLDAERFDACIIFIRDEIAKDQALYLCSHLRNNPRQFNMPVIILPFGDLISDEEGYKAGATIVTPNCDDFELVATQCKLLVGGQRAKWSMRDPMLATLSETTSDQKLHGVYSLNFFKSHLKKQLIDYSKHDGELTMAVFAIRNAPDVKKRFGDEACTMLMQQMADWIQGLLRIEDLTASISEYEFAVILPDTSEKIAAMVANRITGILHHSEFRLTDEIMEAINVWVDLGVATFSEGDSSEDFIKRTKEAIF